MLDGVIVEVVDGVEVGVRVLLGEALGDAEAVGVPEREAVPVTPKLQCVIKGAPLPRVGPMGCLQVYRGAE